jgi:hypothetical protein
MRGTKMNLQAMAKRIAKLKRQESKMRQAHLLCRSLVALLKGPKHGR